MTLTLLGLTLAVLGAASLVAWRYGRSRARVPMLLLGAAITVLAAPPLLDGLAVPGEPHAPDAANTPHHPDDAVVQPEDIERR